MVALAYAEGGAARDPFSVARESFEELVRDLGSGMKLMRHSDLERELEAKGRELLRQLYQGHLDSLGPGEVAEVVKDAEGVARIEPRDHERTLATVFGPVKVRRIGYGVEGRESLHPRDAELNLPAERYSHELRRRAAEEAAKGSYDETVASVARNTGTAVPKRQVEELVSRAAMDFDAFYETRKLEAAVPEARPSGSILVLTTDAKGVVMRKEDLREETRKKAEKATHKLSKRLSKGEKRNHKRMATVAAVYTVAPFVRTPEQVAKTMAPVHEKDPEKRPVPESKRVWASLEKEPPEVLEEAFREGKQRDPRGDKTWVGLVDGNQPQIDALSALAVQYGVVLTLILDIMHVVEYLWKAGLVFHREGTKELQDWVSERLLQILRGRAVHVAAGMRRSATLQKFRRQKRKPVDRCAKYLLNHQQYMRYDQYLAAGLPIATGVIEGACRHLIKDRLEVTGARWSLAGAEAVLKLRALRSSHDFDEYWHFHEGREYERNHATLYEHAQPPATKIPARRAARRALRVVK